MATPKKTRYITPKGVANYCYLDKPDTKFKDAGEFKTNLTLSAEDAAPFVKMADEMIEKMAQSEEVAELEAKRIAWNKNPKNKDKKKQIDELAVNLPYSPAYDDNGDETGDIIFKFSTAHSGEFKSGKRAGEKWTRWVDILDAKKKLLNPVINKKTGERKAFPVWGGTTMKVAFTVGDYVATPQIGYGVKFYLEAVQVIDLVQGGGGGDHGFGEEEGYEGDEEADENASEVDTSDADDSSNDDGAEAF